MAVLTETEAGGRNVLAFLDMIAVSEIGTRLLTVSDDGYNVIVGSTPQAPILFDDYAQHPRRYQRAQNSDAAGRYQIMSRYWEHYRVQLGLPDFGKRSQDLWAIQLIRECRALSLIQGGLFADAVHACRSRWASFPGAGYGQHENALEPLRAAYVDAGGAISDLV